jgi:L-rhamnose-H+ transport protein
MRYLGMSLGMGVALGFCAAFGTFLPPIFKSFFPSIPVAESITVIASSTAGRVTLLGAAVCLLGIFIAALAGGAKEKEMPKAEKKKAIAEFDFKKGILVATFSGIMSACFSFGLTAGNPIGETSAAAGTSVIWSGLPKLIVVILGGFATNFIWCIGLNIKNRSSYEYLARHQRHAAHVKDSTAIGNSTDAPAEEMAGHADNTNAASGDMRIPLLSNYFFSALAGTTWYFQFFFYTWGETQMGEFGFASWTLHMASIIIFSTMWG